MDSLYLGLNNILEFQVIVAIIIKKKAVLSPDKKTKTIVKYKAGKIIKYEFKDLNFSDEVNKLVSIYNDTETLNTQREKLLNLVDFKGSQRIKKIIESIP